MYFLSDAYGQKNCLANLVIVISFLLISSKPNYLYQYGVLVQVCLHLPGNCGNCCSEIGRLNCIDRSIAYCQLLNPGCFVKPIPTVYLRKSIIKYLVIVNGIMAPDELPHPLISWRMRKCNRDPSAGLTITGFYCCSFIRNYVTCFNRILYTVS